MNTMSSEQTGRVAPVELTYRQALPDEVPQIAEILEANRLDWPGAVATPYVAVRPDGEVVAVIFKTLCFHVEPLAAKPGSGFSLAKLIEPIRESFQEFADQRGESVSVYAVSDGSDKSMSALERVGMRQVDGLFYEITLQPEPVAVDS